MASNADKSGRGRVLKGKGRKGFGEDRGREEGDRKGRNGSLLDFFANF